jgi:hypothetical protein
MKSIKLILLSLILLIPTLDKLAWASHGGGVRGGSYGGHALSSRSHGGSYGGGSYRGYGRGYYGGIYGGLYMNPWTFYPPWAYSTLDPSMYGYDGYSEPIVAPGANPVYAEQDAPPSSTNAGQSSAWYYCTNPAGYYPYVKNCSVGWQRVPSHPPN